MREQRFDYHKRCVQRTISRFSSLSDILCVSSFVLEGGRKKKKQNLDRSEPRRNVPVFVCSSAKREFSIRIRVLILRVVIL